MNRFKVLHLVDRVPEKLWMEVHNIVQEAVSKTNPPKKKVMQEGKLVVWEVFMNSWEKKKSQRQGWRERYTQLNAELQRTARRD